MTCLRAFTIDEGSVEIHLQMTSEETLYYHNEPEFKKSSIMWKHLQSSMRKKFKAKIFTGKVIVTISSVTRYPYL
jgi:hypothetical protein